MSVHGCGAGESNLCCRTQVWWRLPVAGGAGHIVPGPAEDDAQGDDWHGHVPHAHYAATGARQSINGAIVLLS